MVDSFFFFAALSGWGLGLATRMLIMRIVNILNAKETRVQDSTFQLCKVKANLQAMKKHLANLRGVSGGGSVGVAHVCVCS